MGKEQDPSSVERKQVADQLFHYLRTVLLNPGSASLDIDSLPPEFADFGTGLRYFAESFMESRDFAGALARGNLSGPPPSPGNEFASTLKALHASLKHLTWQTQQVSKGDYTQRVDFMGDFSNAFNHMVEELDKRQAALVEARMEAENANRAKSLFLATISHEVRTPLNAVIGLSDLQLDGDLPDDVRVALQRINNAGHGLLDLINDILDFSKIEANRLELTPVTYRTAALVNDALQLNLSRIGGKQIQFILDVDETLPEQLCGDDIRIGQILNNLLSNAFKYTQKGVVTLKTTWERVGGDSVWLLFSVRDTGIGIREEDQKRLFSEYSQFDARANRNVEGTGLGMSITKKLVEMMDGEISVRSRHGIGSEFNVRIRQGLEEYQPIGAEAAESLRGFRSTDTRAIRKKADAPHLFPGRRVLVVDDNAINLSIAKGLMERHGLTVDCVESGREAIGRLRPESGDTCLYHAVFMDCMMPEMSGPEAVRIIRNELGVGVEALPIIAFTADSSSADHDALLAGGFNGFLEKPIDHVQLDLILTTFLRQPANLKEAL